MLCDRCRRNEAIISQSLPERTFLSRSRNLTVLMDQSRQWPNPPPKRQRLESASEATYSIPASDGNWTHQHRYGPEASLSGLDLSTNTQNYMLDHLQRSSIAFHAPNDKNDANRRVLDQGVFPYKGISAFRPTLPDLTGNITIINDFVNSDITYGTSLSNYSSTGQAQYPLGGPQQRQFQPILPAQNFFGYGFGYPPSVFCDGFLDARHSTAGIPSQVVGATEESADEPQNSPIPFQQRVGTQTDNLNSADTVCFGMVWSRLHSSFLLPVHGTKYVSAD